MLPLLILVGALVLTPAAFLIAKSFEHPSGVGVDNYIQLFTDSYLLRSLGITIAFCILTAALSTMLSIPTAMWIAQKRPAFQMLRSLCQANFAFNGVVFGVLMVTLLGNTGFVALVEWWLFKTELSRGYVYTTAGLAMAYAGFQIPRAALLFAQAIERLELDLFAAARVLGASQWQVVLWVAVPQLVRPALVVFLAISMMSMGSFGTALLVARTIEIYPVLIYKEFTSYGDFGRACAMGVLLAICCILLDLFARRFATRELAPSRD